MCQLGGMYLKVKAVLDQIVDENYAVLLIGEEEKEFIIAKDKLPVNVEEGSWLLLTIIGDQISDIMVDQEETYKASQRIRDKMALLRKRQGSQYKIEE